MNYGKFLTISLSFLSIANYAMQQDAFLEAVRRGDIEKVKKIIALAVAEGNLSNVLNSKDPAGRTALHMASFGGYPEIVNFLLQNGACVNPVDTHKFTPLHAVVDNPCLDEKIVLEIIGLLAKFGSDLNARNDRRWTALYLAATRRIGLPIAQALQKLGADDKRHHQNEPLISGIVMTAAIGFYELPYCQY
jgi:ankyrin repeat protein